MRSFIRVILSFLWILASLVFLPGILLLSLRLLSGIEKTLSSSNLNSQHIPTIINVTGISVLVLILSLFAFGFVLIIKLTKRIKVKPRFEIDYLVDGDKVLKQRLIKIANIIVSPFKRLLGGKYTVMFIPHQEKPIYNFQISSFMLMFLLFILISLIFLFVFTATYLPIKYNPNTFKQAQRLVSDLGKKINIEQQHLHELTQRKEELEIIIKTQQRIVDSILKIEKLRIQRWYDRIIGFFIAVISSLISVWILAALKRKVFRKTNTREAEKE